MISAPLASKTRVAVRSLCMLSQESYIGFWAYADDDRLALCSAKMGN